MEAILQSVSRETKEEIDAQFFEHEPNIFHKILNSKVKDTVSSKITHGTTTLAFRFSEGILVAVDSRATAGSWIASQTVKKVIEINKFILGTMAGGAADYVSEISQSLSSVNIFNERFLMLSQFWETVLRMECRLYELRHKTRISVAAASKILANILYSYRGMGLSMGTMICGWDERRGSCLFYVDSEGTRLKGDFFCVGSGQTFAYSILDDGYQWNMSLDQAIELGKRAILAATHRDAFSGGNINIYHIKPEGWNFIGLFDVAQVFDEVSQKDHSFQNVKR
ncbi:hypothetical protein PCANB_003062 [Pneumocystis canis]|nr:hypothetical protein PCANB_003062 [Pneumocystis canis]